MNALSQIGKQITDLLASMTPSARIMAGLMVGVIVVSLGWIFNASNTTQYEPLLGGSFSNEQLDRMEYAFGEAQLRGYTRLGRQIKIPSGEKDLYLKALAESNATPATWGSEMEKALNASSIFESAEKLAGRKQNAKERELAGVLQQIRGIEFAAVFTDEMRTGFTRNTDRVCSVYVRGPFDEKISPSTLRTVSKMVSRSFAGLPEEKIGVIDLGSTNFYQASDDPNSLGENPYLTQQMEWEQKYKDQVASLLSNYGNIQLDVNVELDPTLEEESEKLSYDPTAVSVQSSTSRKDVENQRASPGGRPGAYPNEVTTNGAASLTASALDQSSKTKESEENEKRIAGHEATRKRMAGLVPRKVSVFVGVPDSYYREVWLHRQELLPEAERETEYTLAAATEMQAEIETQIRTAVAGIPVGIRAGEETKPFVNVTTYADLPAPEIAGPTFAENSMAWLGESWSTLALLLVLVMSLGMMFSWVRAQSTAPADEKFSEGFGLEIPSQIDDELELSEAGEFTGDGVAGGARPKASFNLTGSDMKEDLSSLIQENPDAAVNLLKTWIGEAA
ncbi:hypothetical protein [Aureliella helgolandensis]|uniref:Flagellar MS-ring protein n=1 Tax=Aureliella helgolandensis TaxID=2527968 RepID=A0A518GET7_9BACT|nr:hypothetical protein [Aureliella helgolandensis]QDV27112.1 flagellar MS-ring protein [Aureliella helgolandensis]